MILPIAEGPEKSVLSSMLRDEHMLARGKAECLDHEHFHLPAHKTLFRAMMRRSSKGEDLELVAFTLALGGTPELESIGGPGALMEVFTYAPNHQHFGQHVAILRQFKARRTAIQAAMSIVEDGEGLSPEDLTAALRKATEATQAALTHDNGLIGAKAAVGRLIAFMEASAENGEMPGQATGLDPVDIVTGGMRSGDLWVIAGPPSGGKSVAMLQAAAEFLKAGKRVLIISLEMQVETVIARLASCMYHMPFRQLMFPKEATKLTTSTARRAFEEIAAMPLTIHDRGGLTIDHITGLARTVSDNGGLDLLVVDYLQLVEGSKRRRDESREQEVAAVSRGLKNLAKQLGCPVLTGSQLNDKGFLRESRAIGQDADVVLAIEEKGIEGRKVRNGTRGQMFPLVLDGEYQRFIRSQS